MSDYEMDPNTVLEAIRTLINDGDSADIALVHGFNALDESLSQGGPLPAAWETRT